jgi:DNA-binding IclR family transcriptional regulator
MEHEEHLRCIGVPIRDTQGYVYASLSLSGLAEINTYDRLKVMAPSLINKGLEISKRLGYHPD